jgi:hypothetical protein
MPHLPKNETKARGFAAKKTQPACRNAGPASRSGIMADFDDNAINGIVAFPA